MDPLGESDDIGYAERPIGMPDVFRCTWQRNGSVPLGARAIVLPDACADIVVDPSGSAVLVGPTMVPHRHSLAERVTLRGLRLQPWAVPLLFRTTASELRDRVLPLDALLGTGPARDVAAEVWHGRLPAYWRGIDTSPWQMELVKSLLRASSGEVELTGRDRGISQRHARRTTRELTGLSPRELAHVGRLHRLLPLIDRADPLAVIAAEAGYTDQAHMSRDLRRLTGATPRRLREERADPGSRSGAMVLTEVSNLLTTP